MAATSWSLLSKHIDGHMQLGQYLNVTHHSPLEQLCFFPGSSQPPSGTGGVRYSPGHMAPLVGGHTASSTLQQCVRVYDHWEFPSISEVFLSELSFGVWPCPPPSTRVPECAELLAHTIGHVVHTTSQHETSIQS